MVQALKGQRSEKNQLFFYIVPTSNCGGNFSVIDFSLDCRRAVKEPAGSVVPLALSPRQWLQLHYITLRQKQLTQQMDGGYSFDLNEVMSLLIDKNRKFYKR